MNLVNLTRLKFHENIPLGVEKVFPESLIEVIPWAKVPGCILPVDAM